MPVWQAAFCSKLLNSSAAKGKVGRLAADLMHWQLSPAKVVALLLGMSRAQCIAYVLCLHTQPLVVALHHTLLCVV
jgi:hypothetical protein